MPSKLIGSILKAIPGERTFGLFRLMPFFFLFGAALEFSMIHWKPNGANFYTTFKRSQSDKEAERRLQLEEFKKKVLANINNNRKEKP